MWRSASASRASRPAPATPPGPVRAGDPARSRPSRDGTARSDVGGPTLVSGCRSPWPALAALVAALLLVPGAGARELISLDEALDAAVPGAASREQQTLFLENADLDQVEERAGSRPASRILRRTVLRDGEGRLLAAAYVDNHVVRTLAERLLIVVDADGRVRRVVVLGFDEPPEYLPSDRWYAQFEGKALGRKLKLKQEIRVLAGATLSSRAATAAVRRALALHALRPVPAEGGP